MTNFEWNDEDPLKRAPGESRKANVALRDYWLMGPGRSFAQLIESYQDRVQTAGKPSVEKPPTTRLATVTGWSTRFDWQARIAARQDIQDAEDEELWRQRRTEVRERDWKSSNSLRELSDRILAEAPKFAKNKRHLIRGEGGEPDREVVTLALNGSLAVRAAEAGSKLSRLAAEMENDRHRLVIEVEKEIGGILDIAERVLSDDEFTKLLAAISGETNGDNALPGQETAD